MNSNSFPKVFFLFLYHEQEAEAVSEDFICSPGVRVAEGVSTRPLGKRRSQILTALRSVRATFVPCFQVEFVVVSGTAVRGGQVLRQKGRSDLVFHIILQYIKRVSKHGEKSSCERFKYTTKFGRISHTLLFSEYIHPALLLCSK